MKLLNIIGKVVIFSLHPFHFKADALSSLFIQEVEIDPLGITSNNLYTSEAEQVARYEI